MEQSPNFKKSFEKAVILPEDRLKSPAPEELADALKYFWSNKKVLYEAAFAMYEKVLTEGLNYRNFGVGAAAVAFNSETKECKIISGWNTKVEKDEPKHCAEKRVYEFAAAEGFDTIVGILVVAQHQADDISQVACTTLHPCLECRELLSQSPLSWNEMPIVTMSIPPEDSDDLHKYSLLEEQHILADLLEKHTTE